MVIRVGSSPILHTNRLNEQIFCSFFSTKIRMDLNRGLANYSLRIAKGKNSKVHCFTGMVATERKSYFFTSKKNELLLARFLDLNFILYINSCIAS